MMLFVEAVTKILLYLQEYYGDFLTRDSHKMYSCDLIG